MITLFIFSSLNRSFTYYVYFWLPFKTWLFVIDLIFRVNYPSCRLTSPVSFLSDLTSCIVIFNDFPLSSLSHLFFLYIYIYPESLDPSILFSGLQHNDLKLLLFSFLPWLLHDLLYYWLVKTIKCSLYSKSLYLLRNDPIWIYMVLCRKEKKMVNLL